MCVPHKLKFFTNKVFKLVHTNSCDLIIIQFHRKAKHSLNFIDGFCMTFSFLRLNLLKRRRHLVAMRACLSKGREKRDNHQL